MDWKKSLNKNIALHTHYYELEDGTKISCTKEELDRILKKLNCEDNVDDLGTEEERELTTEFKEIPT